MKQRQKVNVLVLGSGAAGIKGAKALALGGKTVALVENNGLGGTAYYDGALPVKGLLDAFKSTPAPQIDEVLKSWPRRLMGLNQLSAAKIAHPNLSFYLSEGTFIDDHSYEIEGKIIEAEQIIIATGTGPHSPFEVQIDEKTILSHRYLLNLPSKPEKMVILGGNVEGFELAFVFAKLGFEVTLIEKEKSLLFGNDRDLVLPLEKALMELGCKIKTGRTVKSVTLGEDERALVTLDNGEEIKSGKVLLALARKTNLPKGIEKLNIKVENGFIEVDDHFRTNQRHIYAIGDVNGVHGMAHVAWDQGRVVADEILEKEGKKRKYNLIPRGVFTLPELAGAGLQETDCISQSIPYRVGLANFTHSYRGWSLGEKKGFVKALIGHKDELLGLWMVGEDVCEKVGFFNYFITNKITAQELIETLTINPSLDQSIKQALVMGLNSKEKKR